MNRKTLAVLISAALLSLAADEGSSPWRHQRLYGWNHMTKKERIAFRAKMNRISDYHGQLALWRGHVQWMTERIWNRGLDILPAPEIVFRGPRKYRHVIFESWMMAGDEIEAYRAKEAAVQTKEEYEVFLREHEIALQKRAWDRGLAIGPTPDERKKQTWLREAKLRADRRRR